MKTLDIGSIVRVAGDKAGAPLEVVGIRGAELKCVDGEGGVQWFTRDFLELADDEPAPADTPEDQFTGEDLGAQMAVAEAAFEHSSQIAERGQRVRLLATGLVGQVDEVSTSPAGWSYLVKLDDGGYAWKLGDEFEPAA